MRQTLTLPDELFDKLARGAAQRGLTIENLLDVMSDLVVIPDRSSARDQERSRRIENLRARYRDGLLTEQDRADLNALIDADYREAVTRADRLIAAKQSRSARPRTAAPARARCSSRPARQSRK